MGGETTIYENEAFARNPYSSNLNKRRMDIIGVLKTFIKSLGAEEEVCCKLEQLAQGFRTLNAACLFLLPSSCFCCPLIASPLRVLPYSLLHHVFTLFL